MGFSIYEISLIIKLLFVSRVNSVLPPSFPSLPPVKKIVLVFVLVKLFFSRIALNSPFSERKKILEILVFKWPIGGILEKKKFTRTKTKTKILQETNPEMTYIIGV